MFVGDGDGAPMVLVPGGTFVQGRDGGDLTESPEHKVFLGTYYIDKHEVTVRQFRLFQKEAGKRADRAKALTKEVGLSALDAVEDRPVVMVSARDAKDYADWAGKFLPTEAQWEAAARTPDGRVFPWGPEPPSWNRPRAPRQIDPIMSFPLDVSAYGVFDLAGNAWEWTKDWYEPRYYSRFRNTPADNPIGPAKPRSQQLVVKGTARDWTVSKREGFRFETRLPYLGFRCVLQVEGPGNAFEPPPAPAAPGQPATPARGDRCPSDGRPAGNAGGGRPGNRWCGSSARSRPGPRKTSGRPRNSGGSRNPLRAGLGGTSSTRRSAGRDRASRRRPRRRTSAPIVPVSARPW